MMFAATTQIGESFVGDGADAAHVNTVLGRYGGPVEIAWATALATPRRPRGVRRGAATEFARATVHAVRQQRRRSAGDRHGELVGCRSGGRGGGVADAVADGVVPAAEAAGPSCSSPRSGEPDARDPDAVFANNRRAIAEALANGAARRPAVGDVLAHRDDPFNPYYRLRPA